PLAAATAALAVVPAVVLLVAAAGGRPERSAVRWLDDGALAAGLRLDGLGAVMATTVALAGLAVVVYATGYFARERRARSALAGLLAFLAAMQGLVLAEGLLTLLIFWELVGALSARLIAFSRDDPTAPGGAVRAFLTTRAADVGLYLAVLALLAATGSLAFEQARPEGALGVLVGLGLVLAAMGKSAQAPLQTWLAGAMAGPTPVSALLHSATMVAAGVYLLVRSDALLAGWPLQVAGWVGALTAVAGAAIALGQADLKRVLAGSTSSQLGLMFVGAAAGGPAVAVFHIVAHAAGKACLFLGAGIFQHERGSTALERLAGAGRDDRTALAVFAVGAASIAAVPPLAAFWSKEAIVVAAEGQAAWLALVLIASAGSAAYLLRPLLVLCKAEARAGTPPSVPRPPGRPAMLAGAGALAVASLVLGALGPPLAALLDAPAPQASILTALLSLVAVAAGAGAVLARPRIPAGVRRAAHEQLFTTQSLRGLVQRPVLALAVATDRADRRGLDAAVDGAARAGLTTAALTDVVERRGVDAAVDGLARMTGRGGERLRRLQSGRLYEYLRDSALGAVALAFVLVLTALT
ncbi:MAG TPA: proton-conducting transporter membrane subunit, partial [Solirubrobacteraceae bacterium]|nr:proton-conducting transporter membrane subunit [Solirubrobacteraceae bacterium]